MRFLFSVLLAALVVAPTLAQQLSPEPELPRTAEARPAMAITRIDGVVSVLRDPNYSAGPMAVSLAAAMQGAPPIVTVVGTGRLFFDVNTPTLAEAQAQGYRVYVGTRTVGVNLNATCGGTAAPFNCNALIADFRSQLTQTPQALAATAFVAAEDGLLESSPRTVAPFVLRLAVPPVGPAFSPTPIRQQ